MFRFQVYIIVICWYCCFFVKNDFNDFVCMYENIFSKFKLISNYIVYKVFNLFNRYVLCESIFEGIFCYIYICMIYNYYIV